MNSHSDSESPTESGRDGGSNALSEDTTRGPILIACCARRSGDSRPDLSRCMQNHREFPIGARVGPRILHAATRV